MTEAFSTCSLLFATLLLSFYIFASKAEVVCHSNGCDGCCVTSEYCNTEHTLVSESHQCQIPGSLETPPLIPGVEYCPYDFHNFQYESCHNSYVDDPIKSVGEYGLPNQVGAEFHSLSLDTFSMTVMWEHTDADQQLSLLNRTSVQGYEIRVYEKEPGKPERLRQCLCVRDPRMRNISDIRHAEFMYKEMSHMIVQVRSFPSLIGRDESNTRRNCSLLAECSTTADCRDGCYSWPQSCLNFPSYDPRTCAPPIYGPPRNLNAEMFLLDDYDSDMGQLDLIWDPPLVEDIHAFPVPSTYYVTVESVYSTFKFRVMNTTSISILSLNYTTVYTIFIQAYVRCSGLSQPTVTNDEPGCGNQSRITTVFPPPTTPATPTTPTTPLISVTIAGPTKTMSTNYIIMVAVLVVVALFAVVLTMFAAPIILWRRCMHAHNKPKGGMSTLYVDIDIGLQPKLNTNICVFVFYPKGTEHEDEIFIQTYVVAALGNHAEIKEVKSCDDPYFERGHIPESIDKSFREADFVIIVCNSLFLSEWNSDECSPSVQLLKRYMGNMSIRSDDSISKLITVVLDEQKKQPLSHSRLNLGSIKSFMVTESTWEKDIQNIVRYMTGTPLYHFATQEHSLAVLDTLESPGTPVSDLIPDSSQESNTVTPRTSDSSLSDSKYNHYTQGSEIV